MDRTVKISVTAGDVEIDHEGSAPAIGEMLALLRQDDSWSIMIERLKVAKNAVIETNKASTKGEGDARRGAGTRAVMAILCGGHCVEDTLQRPSHAG